MTMYIFAFVIANMTFPSALGASYEFAVAVIVIWTSDAQDLTTTVYGGTDGCGQVYEVPLWHGLSFESVRQSKGGVDVTVGFLGTLGG